MRTRAAVAIAAGKPLEIMEVNLADPRHGEVLVEIGLKIKSRAGDCPLMVCGNANAASRGYIPTTKALQEGGYETSSFFWQKFAAPYAPDMEDTLVNGVISFFGETI